MVKDREEEVTIVENETRLQQVQDRFPHDDLQLIDRDAKSQVRVLIISIQSLGRG